MSKNKEQHWLKRVDQEFSKMAIKWEYTRLVFTCEYSDREHAKNFIFKRTTEEDKDAYSLRVSKSTPAMDLPNLITSLVGQGFSASKDDVREWGAFGDPTVKSSTAYQISQNADGAGTNWDVFWRQYGTDILLYLQCYILVEGKTVRDVPVYNDAGEQFGVREEIDEPRFVIITPDMVTNKGVVKGRIVWLRVRHEMIPEDVAMDPKAKQEPVTYYTDYTLDGWTRYTIDEETEVETIVGQGEYEFYDTVKRETKVLPIFRVELPFKWYITHYLARMVVRIFNHENALDAFLSDSTSVHYIEESQPWEFQANKEDRRSGDTEMNMAPGSSAYYIAPPEGPATLLQGEIRELRKTLHEMAFQMFGDAAKESTATEIIFDRMSGVMAFLILYVTSLDEAENRAMFIRSQIEYPNDSSKWGTYNVTRSKKFMTLDPERIISMISDMTFKGEALPLTKERIKQALDFIWTNGFGFPVPAEEEARLMEEIEKFLEKRDGLTRAESVEDFLASDPFADEDDDDDAGEGSENGDGE